MPKSAEFQSAFATLLEKPSPKVKNGFLMLKANYRSPGRTISAARLASAAGYTSYSTGNEQYGSFAHKIADILGIESVRDANGDEHWTYTICNASTESDQSGHFQWTLRPEVAEALEALGIVERVVFPDAIADIAAAVPLTAGLSEKSREAFVQARIGQGVFRDRLIKHWQGCAVTGCSQLDLLIASHIKPWRDCSVAEATDMTNGLLLLPNIDRAFDKGFITFDTAGVMTFSPQLSDSLAAQLGLTAGMKLAHIYAQHAPYLDHHRTEVFRTTI